MELKYLNTFRILAKELSFTNAAYILNYAQSSVSAHVRALEDELNTPLFERLGKKVVLTEAGQRMVPAIEKILASIDEMKKTVPESKIPTGTLTIGAHESQLAYRLTQVLRKFRTSCPQVQFIFQPIVSEDNIHSLLCQGHLDAAFILGQHTDNPVLIIEPLVQEKILILCCPNHPLTKLPQVVPSDFNRETILTTEQGCTYRHIFEQVLASCGIHNYTKIEFASIEGIKQCVISGLGIAVLPEITVAKEIAQGQIAVLPWKGKEFNIATQLAWHKDKWISPALEAFIEIARNILY